MEPEMTCAQDAELAKSGSPIGLESPRLEPADSLTLLISALHEQTAAINRLASSNEALTKTVATLIEEMAKGDDDSDPDAQPATYLDGSRVR